MLINVRDKFYSVDSWDAGDFLAVHLEYIDETSEPRRHKYWVISHKPSGYAAAFFFRTPSAALFVAKQLDAELDWASTGHGASGSFSEEFIKAFELILIRNRRLMFERHEQSYGGNLAVDRVMRSHPHRLEGGVVCPRPGILIHLTQSPLLQ